MKQSRELFGSPGREAAVALWGSVGGAPLQRRGAGAGGLRPRTSAAGSGVRRQRAEPAPRVEEMEGARQAGLFYFRDVIQDPVFEDSVL